MRTKRLTEKGWKKKEIDKALAIIKKTQKHPHIKILDKAVFWFSLFTAIIGNFIISIALIPALLALKNFPLYLVIITLGVSFGLLFDLLIRSIENLTARHHLLLATFIPTLAILNFIIISVNMKYFTGLNNPQNPFLTGAAYTISFILPYIIYQLFLKNE